MNTGLTYFHLVTADEIFGMKALRIVQARSLWRGLLLYKRD
jgi:hypothetical protein